MICIVHAMGKNIQSAVVMASMSMWMRHVVHLHGRVWRREGDRRKIGYPFTAVVGLLAINTV